MKRTNFFITEEQLRRLRAFSERGGLSVAEIVRRAIDAYLDAREKEAERKGKPKPR
jgi:predicted DNA-binding protein